ncbi:alpha/beta fold hydrolase [Nocardioides salsibiostraticola]
MQPRRISLILLGLIVPALTVGLSVSAPIAPAAQAAENAPAPQEARVTVGPEADGAEVELDTTTFLPVGDGEHPAVLLTHGFGGSKDDVVDQATDLADAGYVVLTYSARGFGASDGLVHVADPDYEIADSRALIDVLAERDDVVMDSDGDPLVGLVGASYGGAIALMTGATDDRVDTVAAAITWNDLADAFFPQNVLAQDPGATGAPAEVDPIDVTGPLKQSWTSRFFLGTAAQGASAGQPGGTGNPVCGRFAPEVCEPFLKAADTGRPNAKLLELLAAHSPAPLLEGLTAPTYLIQGMADSLFGVEQADATARTLADQGTPVAVRWMDGGHDGISSTADDDLASVETWLAAYLDPAADPDFEAAAVDLPLPPFVFAETRSPRQDSADLARTDEYVDTATWESVEIDDASQPVLNPPGGQPSSITTVPGIGGSLGDFSDLLSTYALAALPGQSAAFDTPAFEDSETYVGTPRVTLSVTSTNPSATLFLSLWQLPGGPGSDQAELPRRVVSPITVPTTPGEATEVEVALPGGTWEVSSGESLRVLVTSTDQTFAAPRQARADLVSLTDLRMPTVESTPIPGAGSGNRDTESIVVLTAMGLLALGLLVAAALRRRRRRLTPRDESLADVPLVIDSLVKTYSDGHRAVDNVSWRAERGQVVGLLGPNGAGKTTTLRMVMGLIRPDSGAAHVLGDRVEAGSPVLARVGALIEGPGFLPHMTGMDNLRAYWSATGRSDAEAGYDEVLEVAALGGAVDRPVRTYSHGMRQRLGIAQAMLGLPEVLVLDEPTNGLDPPQIAGLRPILARYAAAGRTVVVSSHLLSEVELTCTHVVVMHAGRVVTTGTVAELVDNADTTVITLDAGSEAERAATTLRSIAGIDEVEAVEDPTEPHVVVTSSLARAEVVREAADAGLPIVGVSSRRHLEEVFLGVIAAAATGDGPPGAGRSDLRQVRSR